MEPQLAFNIHPFVQLLNKYIERLTGSVFSDLLRPVMRLFHSWYEDSFFWQLISRKEKKETNRSWIIIIYNLLFPTNENWDTINIVTSNHIFFHLPNNRSYEACWGVKYWSVWDFNLIYSVISDPTSARGSSQGSALRSLCYNFICEQTLHGNVESVTRRAWYQSLLITECMVERLSNTNVKHLPV